MTLHEEHNGHDVEKRNKILRTCQERDIDQLRALSTSHSGLLDDEVRCAACMCSALQMKKCTELRNLKRADITWMRKQQAALQRGLGSTTTAPR